MPLITSQFQDDPSAALKKFETATLPKFCGHLENLLGRGGGPFVTGRVLTYADISTYEFLQYASEALAKSVDDMLQSFPKVLCGFKEVAGFHHIQAYLSSKRRKGLPNEVFVR